MPGAATVRFGPGARCRFASAPRAGQQMSGIRRATGLLAYSCDNGLRLVSFDDMFLSPGTKPFLAQQPPHLNSSLLIEARGMFGVHQENLESRSISRGERSQQIAGTRVEHLCFNIGPQRPAKHLADRATLLP